MYYTDYLKAQKFKPLSKMTGRMENMDITNIEQYARALYNAHDDKAEAEAAQKMRICEEAGKTDEARDWKKIREAIRAMRGANQS